MDAWRHLARPGSRNLSSSTMHPPQATWSYRTCLKDKATAATCSSRVSYMALSSERHPGSVVRGNLLATITVTGHLQRRYQSSLSSPVEKCQTHLDHLPFAAFQLKHLQGSDSSLQQPIRRQRVCTGILSWLRRAPFAWPIRPLSLFAPTVWSCPIVWVV